MGRHRNENPDGVARRDEGSEALVELEVVPELPLAGRALDLVPQVQVQRAIVPSRVFPRAGIAVPVLANVIGVVLGRSQRPPLVPVVV